MDIGLAVCVQYYLGTGERGVSNHQNKTQEAYSALCCKEFYIQECKYVRSRFITTLFVDFLKTNIFQFLFLPSLRTNKTKVTRANLHSTGNIYFF